MGYSLSERNHYQVLGVPSDANLSDIKVSIILPERSRGAIRFDAACECVAFLVSLYRMEACTVVM